MKLTWEQFVFLLWLVVSCHASSPGNKENNSGSLDHQLPSDDNWQSSRDWWVKRGLGGPKWDIRDLSRGTFQNWQESFHKRGLLSSPELGNFGRFDNSKFQEWKDWLSKRGLNFAAPFAGYSDLDKGQFQQWNDWVSKRNFDFGVDGFGRGPNTAVGLQNWADFAKRQNFVFPSSEMGGSNNVRLQDWQDWVKRVGSNKAWSLQDYQFGNKDRYIKRQLGFSPDRYGSFGRYFTHGLQDWRSTFRSTKRNKNKTDKPTV